MDWEKGNEYRIITFTVQLFVWLVVFLGFLLLQSGVKKPYENKFMPVKASNLIL